MELIIQIVNRLILGLADAAPLALVTLAIVLIFRTSYTTNFAQGMISTSAAYVTAIFYSSFLMTRFPGANPILMTIIAFIVGIIIGFLLGIFIDTVIIRHAKFTTVVSKQIITMGVVLVLLGLLPTIFARFEINMPLMPKFFTDQIIIPVGETNLRIQHNHLFIIGIAAVVISSVFALLKFTKWGLGVRATASNERVAGLMGINTKFITRMSWGIAGMLGALGAILYAGSQVISSGFMVEMQVNGFLASILGGFTSFIGPIIGAVIIPILNVLIGFFTQNVMLGSYSLAVYTKVFVYIIVLVIILIKPLGLFGKKIIKKV